MVYTEGSKIHHTKDNFKHLWGLYLDTESNRFYAENEKTKDRIVFSLPELIYGQGMYSEELAKRLPNYIHEQAWTIHCYWLSIPT